MLDFVELGSKDVLNLVELIFKKELVIRTSVRCVYYFVSLLLKSMLFHIAYLITTLKIGAFLLHPCILVNYECIIKTLFTYKNQKLPTQVVYKIIV